MWKLRNIKNGDEIRFDDASTCVAVFDIMKRDGYAVVIIEPNGITVARS